MRTAQQDHLNRLTAKERQAATEFVEKVRQRFDGQLIAAVLFGSRARGEAEPDSDMDVLVVMSSAGPEIRKEIRHLAVEVWLEHDIYLSTRVWSQVHWRKLEGLKTLLYQNIHRDGINLLELSPAHSHGG
ncbi:MAG: nucleotidyltransferase domain-containing protein [Anaerolineae bacterium]|nr:MAG: nucleotidyltransferase domain-containing protein [Anaerolineae bacterium]